MKQKLLKNISWLFFDKIIKILGGLIVGVWVARYLGPENFGILNYALAYTAFFMLFVNLGLDEIIVREIVKKPKLTNYLMGTAFSLKLIGSIVAILSVLISFCFIETDAITKSVIFIISMGFVLQSIDVIDYFYQSKVLSKYVVIARDSAFVLSSLLKVYFIVYKYSVIYFALSSIIDLALAGLFLILIYKKNGYNLAQWKFSKKIAIKLLKFSWPLALSVFLISIHTRIDQVMIGNMLNIEQVGIYSVAVRLAEFWIFIPSILVSTLMPYFVNLREINNKLYHDRLIQLYSLMFWMGVFVGVFVMIWGKDIIGLLYGEAYVGAYSALMFNIWTGIFISQAVARGIWMINENLQVYRIYNNVLSIITNVGLNMVLISKYGIEGAAIASFVSIGLGTWIYSLLFAPMRKSTLAMVVSILPINLLLKKEKNG